MGEGLAEMLVKDESICGLRLEDGYKNNEPDR